MSWVIFAACFVVSFIFSGIEAGILSVNRVRLAHWVRQEDAAAMTLQRLLAHPERILITVLLVTNLANISALFIVAQNLVAVMGRSGYLVALAIYLPTYLFLELLPKSLFRRFPYRALVFFAQPLRLVDLMLTPLHLIGRIVQRLLLGGRPPERQRMFIGREDFRFYAEQGEKSGTLTRAEREMITNVVDFRAVLARDVMTPIDPARRISGSAPVGQWLERAGNPPADRWFVTDEHGAITGTVSAFEVLIERRRDVQVGVYQRRPVVVGPVEPAYSVLRKLRAARAMVAIVRSASQAEPMGKITWEDLIRRMVAAAGQQLKPA